MNTPKSSQLRSPYRRRRILWSLFLLTAAALFYLTTHDEVRHYFSSWSLPAYLKDIDRSGSSSRAGLVSNAKANVEAETARVPEIDGLLHFVTQFPDRRLNEDDGGIEVKGLGHVQVNPHEPVDLRAYAPDGDEDWSEHVEELHQEYPLVIFSKTYCPYSRKAKTLLLETYALSPPPFVVELDTRTDGLFIQAILNRLTKRSTVPNIILRGQSIGGSDDIHKMDEEGTLRKTLEDGGLVF